MTSEAAGLAKQYSDELIQALDDSQRTSELASSPLALVLLTLIHRSGKFNGKQFPERRVDLYEMALEVLLERDDNEKRPGKKKLNRPEKRRTLEMIAFWLHQHNKNEITRDELSAILQTWFLPLRNGDETLAAIEVETFLQEIVEQDNGLFVEHGLGIYCFAHRTFQEVLAAQALADRDDTLAYTRKCLSIPWWRDVILFEAGLLGRQAKHRVSELIRFIIDEGTKSGLKPYHASFLAAECLLDLDPKHLEIGLLIDVRNSLQKLANATIREGDRQGFMEKVIASNTLVSLQGGQTLARFWKLKFGEPEWVKIPAGEFWMGETNPDSAFLAHRLFLPEYQIARVTVTNAQYALYLKDSGHEPPISWHNGQTPRGRENHPVVNVNWHEALAYCAWLGGKINKPVSLPSEAEWEKAARGAQDQREYPWGAWDELRANTSDLLLGDTTPVGMFPNGASPYGVLDMIGNVREWTRSLFGVGYPYDPTDKAREDLRAPNDQPRVLRGGSYYCSHDSARCTDRQRYYPDFSFYNFGFRVVISPVSAPAPHAAHH
jgi:formylglycine-generating enzyme required for sulfatase activity